MPHSHHCFITQVIDEVKIMNPMSILDVGIGFGKWGHLFRENTDIMIGRLNKEDWVFKIDGVEICEKYLNEHTKYFYSDILIGDICDLVDVLPRYDLVYFGDILEHIEKNKAIKVLEKIRTKNMIISIPLGPWPQDEIMGNPYEKHISTWCEEDFKKHNPQKIYKKNLKEGTLGLIII
jgi:2-polyprenyl-3-methyl-5-hydroxy-6-metoxy-1,4-benzoquinol methylase